VDPTSERAAALRALARERFDLLIVGGGITGAAVALLAVHAGLRVALVERGDFASGTSSRSSRLLHGGFRYLAQGRFGLVGRLAQARDEMAQLAPHLTQEVPLLIPWGTRGAPGRWSLRLAGAAYGLLADQVDVLNRSALLALEPGLDGAGPDGALLVREVAVHDARLVSALLRQVRAGGGLTLSGVACQAIDAGTSGANVILRDETDAEIQVQASVVVNAAGPFCDEVTARTGGARVKGAARLSRGTHLAVPHPRLPLTHTTAFFSPRDGRALFAAPRAGFVLIGTTEVELPPQQHRDLLVRPSPAEVAYLLQAASAAFPDARLRQADVAAAFAGVRPLPASRRKDAGAIDRDYVISWDAPRLLTLRGGTLTLALEGARRALTAMRRASSRLGLAPFGVAQAGELPPVGRRPQGATRDGLARALRELGLPMTTADHIVTSYAVDEAQTLLALMRTQPSLRQPLREGLPHVTAEWRFARQNEGARCWEDFARRRSDLALRASVLANQVGVDDLHPHTGRAA
jgi:glycerol-3-phosphate dehydrogenase